MIRSKRGLVTVALVAFFVGFLAKFPARVVYKWANPPGITLDSVQGTIWRGTARHVSVNGVYLRDLEWRMNVGRLFTGKLGYAVSAKPQSGFFESDLALSLGGSVLLSELSASIPLPLIADTVGVRGLRGAATLQFDSVEIAGGIAVAADGTLGVADVVVPQIGGSSIGGYEAVFSTHDDEIVARVADTDGIVDIDGTLRMRRDRSFEFKADVAAKPQTPKGLQQQIGFLPPADDPGKRELRLEGTL